MHNRISVALGGKVDTKLFEYMPELVDGYNRAKAEEEEAANKVERDKQKLITDEESAYVDNDSWNAKRDREQQQAELRKRTNNSIRILAQGMVSDQLTLTEGCIRISALLDSLGISDEQKQDYRAIFQLSQETAHIPILGQWKTLSKQEQINFDIKRITLEQKYADFIKDDAIRLQKVTF